MTASEFVVCACNARYRRKQAIRAAQIRGPDRLRHPADGGRQVRRYPHRADQGGRSFRGRPHHCARRRRGNPRPGQGMDRGAGDRCDRHHGRHRLYRPRRDPRGGRAAVREEDGRLRGPLPDGEFPQDRNLRDPDPGDRGRCQRDLYLLPARIAGRLPRCLGRDPGAPARLPLLSLQFRRVMSRLDEHLRRAKVRGAIV